ncbi:FecCD family ABC transporter permease [Alkaliphilus oremlandii]|uniref:Transport system permease protein n=1 Tax=Alkaliphilus oremlandii (strain OhILAs) TaxID=350688 RepID=A8MFV8_ALKOO|nr:iron ABC transporter permease [Alkaliphilus oremlandii]ABW18496.1 transport system permease protein [Alkaliphilus oremlandii OhILAs]
MRKNLKTTRLFLLLILLLLFSIALNIRKGSVDLNLKSLMDVILGNRELSQLESNILFKIRLPRIISAILFGGALSISGFLLQTFFKNPIVGPFVLGVSSGAKLFVGLFILTTISIPSLISGPFEMFLIAFVGSMLVMSLVLLFAKSAESISVLIVVGIMIGYVASAGTDFMMTFASEQKIATLTTWSMGTFSGVTWDMIKVSAIIIIPTTLSVFFLSKPLQGYLLGENYAKSMGINIKAFRIILITLSSILSACVTAFAGPVSFVGIAVPHLTRLTCKTSNPKILTPAIFLLGASFTLIADYFARTLFSPVELNISTVTSFIGAPLIIWLMLNRRKRI